MPTKHALVTDRKYLQVVCGNLPASLILGPAMQKGFVRMRCHEAPLGMNGTMRRHQKKKEKEKKNKTRTMRMGTEMTMVAEGDISWCLPPAMRQDRSFLCHSVRGVSIGVISVHANERDGLKPPRDSVFGRAPGKSGVTQSILLRVIFLISQGRKSPLARPHTSGLWNFALLGLKHFLLAVVVWGQAKQFKFGSDSGLGFAFRVAGGYPWRLDVSQDGHYRNFFFGEEMMIFGRN